MSLYPNKSYLIKDSSLYCIDLISPVRSTFQSIINVFFSGRRRHTRLVSYWSSDVCSSDLASFGPYSVKLIVPVGLVPRVRCATSDTCPPAATEPLAVVVSAGAAFVTTTASAGSAQARSEERRVGQACRSRAGQWQVTARDA